jgi:chemotaxis protein MotB
MADKGDIIIIKKKKGGGGHGHHGGAWKVAYADFVTAMMAFFLVMWLMGSDEETKAAISHYFNHPNSPYKAGKDPKSDLANPLGEHHGVGDSVMSGMEGFWPKELLDTPQPVRDVLTEQKVLTQMLEDLLEGVVYGMDYDKNHITFSLPENILFANGSNDLTDASKATLDTLGQVLKGFKGYLTVTGHTDEAAPQNSKFKNNWELSFSRAVSVMDYLVKKHGLEESRITPQGQGPRKPLNKLGTPEELAKNRRVEFTLSYVAP